MKFAGASVRVARYSHRPCHPAIVSHFVSRLLPSWTACLNCSVTCATNSPSANGRRRAPLETLVGMQQYPLRSLSFAGHDRIEASGANWCMWRDKVHLPSLASRGRSLKGHNWKKRADRVTYLLTNKIVDAEWIGRHPILRSQGATLRNPK